MKKGYLVFISHSGDDSWVAKQLSSKIRNAGASTFLDSEKIQAGDMFDPEIFKQIKKSRELVAYLTPWSLDRPYVWMEIGGALTEGIRVVGILHGMTEKQFFLKKKNVSCLTSKHLIHLNDLDTYLKQLKGRIAKKGDLNENPK